MTEQETRVEAEAIAVINWYHSRSSDRDGLTLVEKMRQTILTAEKRGASEQAEKDADRTRGPLEVGPYVISRDNQRGGYWIEHNDGEGMAVSESKFLVFIQKFWEDNF